MARQRITTVRADHVEMIDMPAVWIFDWSNYGQIGKGFSIPSCQGPAPFGYFGQRTKFDGKHRCLDLVQPGATSSADFGELRSGPAVGPQRSKSLDQGSLLSHNHSAIPDSTQVLGWIKAEAPRH